MSILVVEAEPALRGLLAAILRAAGHDVVEAADCDDALCTAERDVPALTLLDPACPEGSRFLEQLRARGLRPLTRVLIVGTRPSGWAPDGSDSVLVPFNTSALLTAVEEALRERPSDLYARRERADRLVRLLRSLDELLA